MHGDEHAVEIDVRKSGAQTFRHGVGFEASAVVAGERVNGGFGRNGAQTRVSVPHRLCFVALTILPAQNCLVARVGFVVWAGLVARVGLVAWVSVAQTLLSVRLRVAGLRWISIRC